MSKRPQTASVRTPTSPPWCTGPKKQGDNERRQAGARAINKSEEVVTSPARCLPSKVAAVRGMVTAFGMLYLAVLAWLVICMQLCHQLRHEARVQLMNALSAAVPNSRTLHEQNLKPRGSKS